MLTQQIDMLTTQLTHILSWEGIYGYHDMTYSWDEVLPSFEIPNWKLTYAENVNVLNIGLNLFEISKQVLKFENLI